MKHKIIILRRPPICFPLIVFTYKGPHKFQASTLKIPGEFGSSSWLLHVFHFINAWKTLLFRRLFKLIAFWDLFATWVSRGSEQLKRQDHAYVSNKNMFSSKTKRSFLYYDFPFFLLLLSPRLLRHFEWYFLVFFDFCSSLQHKLQTKNTLSCIII